MHATAAHPARHCCFLVGGDCFAVPSAAVAEVLREGRLTRVPLAADAVVGLVHLRGRIVPVVDLRRRLGIAPSDSSPPRTHLVVALDDDWYSLLVDEMLDVVEVPADAIEPAAHASAHQTAEPHGDAVVGVFAGPERLVHFLDPQRIIQALGRQRDSFLSKQGTSHGGA